MSQVRNSEGFKTFLEIYKKILVWAIRLLTKHYIKLLRRGTKPAKMRRLDYGDIQKAGR